MPRYRVSRDVSPSVSSEGSTVPSVPDRHIPPVRYTGPPPKSILRHSSADGGEYSQTTRVGPPENSLPRRRPSRLSDDRRTNGRQSETKPRRRSEASESRHTVSAPRVPQVKHDARDRDTHRGGPLGTETTGSRRVRSGLPDRTKRTERTERSDRHARRSLEYSSSEELPSYGDSFTYGLPGGPTQMTLPYRSAHVPAHSESYPHRISYSVDHADTHPQYPDMDDRYVRDTTVAELPLERDDARAAVHHALWGSPPVPTTTGESHRRSAEPYDRPRFPRDPNYGYPSTTPEPSSVASRGIEQLDSRPPRSSYTGTLPQGPPPRGGYGSESSVPYNERSRLGITSPPPLFRHVEAGNPDDRAQGRPTRSCRAPRSARAEEPRFDQAYPASSGRFTDPGQSSQRYSQRTMSPPVPRRRGSGSGDTVIAESRRDDGLLARTEYTWSETRGNCTTCGRFGRIGERHYVGADEVRNQEYTEAIPRAQCRPCWITDADE